MHKFKLAWGGLLLLAPVFGILGCAQSLEDFQEGLRVLSGRGGTVAKYDVFAQMEPVAKKNLRGEPVPVWQTTLHADETDFIEYLSDDRILVGTMVVSTTIAAPSHGPIQLYDAHNGALLWQADRPQITDDVGSYQLLLSDPVILLAGVSTRQTHYIAYEPATGAVRWELDVAVSGIADLDTANNLLVVGRKVAAGLMMEAVRIADGTLAWNRLVAKEALDSQSRVLTSQSQGKFFLAGHRLTCLDLRTGKIDWSVATPWDWIDSFTVQSGTLLAFSANKIAAYSAETGTPLWKPQTNEGWTVSAIFDAPAKRRAYLWISGAEIVLKCIDLDSGKPLWTHKSVGVPQSPPIPILGRLFYSTPASLVGVSTETGRQRVKVGFPRKMQVENPLTAWDIIRPVAGEIVISRARCGVMIVNPERERIDLEHHILPGGDLDSYLIKIVELNQTIKFYSPKETVVFSPDMDNIWSTNLADMEEKTQKNIDEMRVLQEKARRNYAQTAMKYGESCAYGFDYHGLSTSEQYERRQMRSNSIEKGIIYSSVIQSVGFSIADAIRDQAKNSAISRKSLEVGHSVSSQEDSIQGRFYLNTFRSISTEGPDGVSIVNLQSKKRKDIIFGVLNPVVGPYMLRMPTFAISPDQEYLVTSGIGLDVSKWERYVKFKHAMPYPALMKFRLN